MIASVEGPVLVVAGDSAVLAVGGVGLRVHCTGATLAGLRPGVIARLATSLVVREDSLTLFGFGDDDERELFETLQSATGVGPRLAQAALAVLRPDELRRAVATEDLTTLCRVPGIGRKGAQRIVVELKDRIGAVAAGPAASIETPSEVAGQVIQALQSLGWGPREAEPAAAAAVAAAGPQADVATVLKVALRGLQRA